MILLARRTARETLRGLGSTKCVGERKDQAMRMTVRIGLSGLSCELLQFPALEAIVLDGWHRWSDEGASREISHHSICTRRQPQASSPDEPA
jgi:hypothetical protein